MDTEHTPYNTTPVAFYGPDGNLILAAFCEIDSDESGWVFETGLLGTGENGKRRLQEFSELTAGSVSWMRSTTGRTAIAVTPFLQAPVGQVFRYLEKIEKIFQQRYQAESSISVPVRTSSTAS